MHIKLSFVPTQANNNGDSNNEDSNNEDSNNEDSNIDPLNILSPQQPRS